jgi:hypothetical protein
MYKGKSMEQVLKQDTVFKNVEVAMSLLNDTDTTTVASCSVNWYIVNNNGIPSQTCDEYTESDCTNNEDLVYDTDVVRCIEPSTAPSAMPSMESTEFLTINTTMYPTSERTDIPTISPTTEPESEIPTGSNKTDVPTGSIKTDIPTSISTE